MTAGDVSESGSAILTVHLDAIIENYLSLGRQSSSADCATVVKANAYGLGMEQVATALHHHGNCKIFFVANIKEAITLRALIKDAVIYVFNGLLGAHIDLYLEHNVRPILNNLSQVKLWQGRNRPCAVHFDTGINRLGLSESETEKFLNNAHDLNLSLILSHLACAEHAQSPNNKNQLLKFTKISNALPNIPASLANSAGIYLGEDYHFDLLRPGIMLYGGNPGLSPAPIGIKDTFEITGKILQIKNLEAGMSVGYNATWTANRSSRIAIINLGYADGMLKVDDKGAKVSIKGHMVPVIGKVSMDMLIIDITGSQFDHIDEENDVELIGSNITLEMACEVSTLGHYEFLTSIGSRLHKNYNLGTFT